MRKRCRGGPCIETAIEGEKFCPKCKAKAEEKFQRYSKLYDQIRYQTNPQIKKFYNSKEWKMTREEVLTEFPICQECNKAFSSEVHHSIPIRSELGWEKRLEKNLDSGEQNLKAWCKPCHTKHEKTKLKD